MNSLPNTQSKPLVFSTRSYPTFGRGKKEFDETNPPQTVINSPYYWWFMFLRLSEDYSATCKAKGKGKCAELYKDFGDIYKVNFKDWWATKAHLFAEPKKGYRMMIANSIGELAPFNDGEVLNLVVPLTWSQRSLKKAFTSLVLKRIEKGKRGVSVEKSEAKYKLSGKWHIEALMAAYRIYSIKSQCEKDGVKKFWADIGIEAKLPMSFALKGSESKQNSDVRRMLTIIADRHYKRAAAFIKSATSNSFPHGK